MRHTLERTRSLAAYTHGLWTNGDVRNQGWYERCGNSMGSAGRAWSLRGHARAETLAGVGDSEGFAPGRVVWICAVWALIHSVLASKQVKDLTRRIAGPRYRDGLYRFTFNAQSVVLLLWAARRFSRLPDRELYRVVVSISRSNPCNAGASSRAR